MSTRNIAAELATAAAADTVHPILFLYGDFPTGPVRIWTGYGDITWGGFTWKGLGHLLKIDAIAESTDSGAAGISVEVDGFQEEFFSPIMLGNYQGQEAKIWFAALDPDTEDLVSEPYLLYSGFLDSDEVLDAGAGQSSTVKIMVEHRLADLLRARSFRYTHEDQQTLYPDANDKGLEFVAALQEVDLKWGKA